MGVMHQNKTSLVIVTPSNTEIDGSKHLDTAIATIFTFHQIPRADDLQSCANHGSIAFFKASTSPLVTAFKAASLNFFRFSRASASRLALVFELPLGATSLSNFAESLDVKLTKSIANPPLGVLGVLGVRGALELERDRARPDVPETFSPLSLIGPDLWIDFRR
jgi:hypothetical protein